MDASPGRRWVALLLSLVPGWGHVYLGRELAGLAIFTLSAVLGFTYLNARFVYLGEGRELLSWTSGVLTLLAWGATVIDLFVRSSPARLARDAEARQRLLDQGTIAFMKGDLEGARILFRQCLRIDPRDVEALFRLGIVCSRSAKSAEAERWLRRTRRCDLDEKWSWEIERELARLEKGSVTAPPAATQARDREEAEPASA